jgi:uncharacterized protein
MKGFISKDLHPFWVLLLLLAFMLGAVFIAQFIFAILANLFYDMSLFEFVEIAGNPAEYTGSTSILMLFQALVSFFMFILAPLFLIQSFGYSISNYLNWKHSPWLLLILLSGLLVILIMPANSVIINWNATFDLPDSMQGFENWAKAKEAEAAELTKLLAKFGSISELFVGLLVIAVIPAIGEELVFRGVVQRELHRWSGNAHVAVWVAAIIFGAIHIQFYGFLPRTILGALFGYLYLWSGHISVPIIAHFFNNGFTVFLLYLHQNKLVDFEIDSTDSMPIYTVILSILLSTAAFYYLYKNFIKVPHKQDAVPIIPAHEVYRQ